MNDREFLALLDNMEAGEPAATREEIDRTLDLAMRRAGFNRRRRPGPRILLVAAALTAGLLAAAAYYSVTDAFRGVLSEQKGDGTSGPVESMAPIVERSGSLPEASDTVGGYTVSLRAVVGDGDSYKMLVDIVGPPDKPLAVKNGDGTLSDGELGFLLAELVAEDPDSDDLQPMSGGGSWRSTVLKDNNPADNQVSLLLEGHFRISAASRDDPGGERQSLSLSGKRMTLRLKNLQQIADSSGEDPGFPCDNAQELLAHFPAPAEKDFENTGNDGDSYDLAPGDKAVMESTRFPTLKIDNAGIFNGHFCISGSVGAEDIGALDNVALRRLSDNRLLMPVSMSGGSPRRGEPDPISRFSIDFGPASWLERGEALGRPITAAFLKDYILVTDAGLAPRTIMKGTWSLPFAFNDRQPQRVITPNRVITLDGIAVTVTKIDITPLSVTFHLRADERAEQSILERLHGDGGWPAQPPDIILSTSEGAFSFPQSGSGGGGGEYTIWFGSDSGLIIDPEGVVSIQWEEESFSLP